MAITTVIITAPPVIAILGWVLCVAAGGVAAAVLAALANLATMDAGPDLGWLWYVLPVVGAVVGGFFGAWLVTLT
jgi:hypothetical protein